MTDGTSLVKAEPEEPQLPLPPAKTYSTRFRLVYVSLAVLVIGGVGGAFYLSGHTLQGSSSNSWSAWKPAPGSTAAVAHEIAQHVAAEYHVDKKGDPLLAVVSGPPQIASGTHKVSISNIAVDSSAVDGAGIQVTPSGGAWVDQLCGLGSACSIAKGKASVERGRLVRREALEVALYTFKFAPAINSVVAFMPPPPGSSPSTLLYLQKDNFRQQLAQPLRKTLLHIAPPLPTQGDPAEASTIDRLTLRSVYSYSVQQLQDASAILILNPITGT